MIFDIDRLKFLIARRVGLVLATAIVLGALAAGLPCTAKASTEGLAARVCLGEKIEITTLDAANTSFTINRSNAWQGWDLMIVYISVVDGGASSVTNVTMSCTASEDDNTTPATIQDCTTAAGVCTSNDAGWEKDPASTGQRWAWRVDISGFQDIECTLTDDGGDASDSIQVYNVCLTTK